MKKSSKHGIEHGEIWLKPVDSIPDGVVTNHKSFIVGHSETGHHHVVESETAFEVTEDEKHDLYIRLFKPAKLVHQKTFDKHQTLPVTQPMYKVLRKTEYSPWDGLIRQVKD